MVTIGDNLIIWVYLTIFAKSPFSPTSFLRKYPHTQNRWKNSWLWTTQQKCVKIPRHWNIWTNYNMSNMNKIQCNSWVLLLRGRKNKVLHLITFLLLRPRDLKHLNRLMLLQNIHFCTDEHVSGNLRSQFVRKR